MSLAVNHTSFTVRDLDRTMNFFRTALGLTVESYPAATRRLMEGVTGVDGAEVRLAVVRCPGHLIELFEYLNPADRQTMKPRPCDPGFTHIAFEVDSIDAVVAAAEPFQFRPVRPPIWVDVEAMDVLQPDAPATTARMLNCYLRDPDGLTIELMQY